MKNYIKVNKSQYLCVFLMCAISQTVYAETYGGIEFPGGAASFVDAVVSYEPDFGGGATPGAPYDAPARVIGVPDGLDTSLGSGGRITMRFTDNALTGSGDDAPDLHIFELGSDVEDTFVEISKNGVDFMSLGKVFGSTSSIDIDAFGFTAADSFYYVRLRDDPDEGATGGVSVGADIDAVGAITTTLGPPPSGSHPCDPAYVSVDASGDFLVTPSSDTTGMTDTTNLQCVNNAIENQFYHAVKLNNGSYYIKEISLNCPSSKRCTFAGTTRTNTILNLVDDSIDCQGRLDNNIATGGLSFRGNILVQFMTINADSPCMGDGFLPGLIVFTGAPAVVGDSCGNSVLFGTLNRVDVNATYEMEAGVLVSPQGRWLGDSVCQDGLSGSFTSTRTSIDGSYFGIEYSMQSGARVGLDFFESTNSTQGIRAFDSNAISAINFCNISGTATSSGSSDQFMGIKVLRFSGAPKTTTTNINKCTFNLTSESGSSGAWGVFIKDYSPSSSMPVVVSESTFNHMGSQTYGVQLENVSNCTITANQFNGSGGDAISIYSRTTPVSGCTVTANKGLAEFPTVFPAIYASSGTLNNVLGLHPATIVDEGCNFDLNDPSGGCAMDGGIILKNDSSGSTVMSKPPMSPQSQKSRTPGSDISQLRPPQNRR